MGLKDYVQRKREEFALKQEEKRKTRELQEKLDYEADIQSAKEQRAKYERFKQARKAREELKQYKAEIRKDRFERSGLGRISSGLDAFGSGLRKGALGIESSRKSFIKSQRKSGKSEFDLGLDSLFGERKTKVVKRRKRRK